MLHMLPLYKGMLFVQSPCPTAFYMHVNHIMNRCFNWCSRPAAILILHNGYSFNALSLINMSAIFSTVWTAQNRRMFLIMLMSPYLLPFSANLSFQNRNGAKSGQYRDAEQTCHCTRFSWWCMTFKLAHFSDFLNRTYWKITHFRDRFGPIFRLASWKTTATTTWWLFTL